MKKKRRVGKLLCMGRERIAKAVILGGSQRVFRKKTRFPPSSRGKKWNAGSDDPGLRMTLRSHDVSRTVTVCGA